MVATMIAASAQCSLLDECAHPPMTTEATMISAAHTASVGAGVSSQPKLPTICGTRSDRWSSDMIVTTSRDSGG